MRILLCLLFCIIHPCDARVLVNIGMTDTRQPPFVTVNGEGLSLDIVNALNKVQTDYLFVHKVYPTKRLHASVKNGSVDIVSFQNPLWFKNHVITGSSCILFQSKDVFFALRVKVDNESYFDNIESKEILAIAGFHYAFAEGNNDTEFLHSNFNIVLAKNETAVIRGVLKGRGDVGIASKSTLDYLRLEQPGEYEKLQVSQLVDSTHDRHFLLFANSVIDTHTFNEYLSLLDESGVMGVLFNKYGLPWRSCNHT